MFNFAKNTEGVLKITIMAYRDFSMDDLERKFGIQEIGIRMFDVKTLPLIQPSNKLKEDLAEADEINLSTEKAVSERLVAPVLVEIKKRNDFVQIFSGEIITADKSEGLNGEIDFIYARKPVTSKPNTPLLCVTEAKLGFPSKAFPQACAQMLGLRLFNHKKGHDVNIIHGIVTDGRTWRVLKLEEKNLYVDLTEYSISELSILLGVLQKIIDFYKEN
jgi:hypothetical protein